MLHFADNKFHLLALEFRFIANNMIISVKKGTGIAYRSKKYNG